MGLLEGTRVELLDARMMVLAESGEIAATGGSNIMGRDPLADELALEDCELLRVALEEVVGVTLGVRLSLSDGVVLIDTELVRVAVALSLLV